MKENVKNAVEEHLLKASGFKETSRGYKLIQGLFKLNELDFKLVKRDDAIEIRKELWFLKFECAMRWDRIVLTDDAIINYYQNVMGMQMGQRDLNSKIDDDE